MAVRQLSPRPGISLLEVLTAIFIMGIGMMALLTLFPAGALSMARAVRDDRAATIGANAVALARAFKMGLDDTKPPTENVTSALSNPAKHPDANANPQLPSNPVLVDGTYPGTLPSDLDAYNGGPGIQRVAPLFAPDSVTRRRFFTFQDEIVFNTLGGAKDNPVNRPGSYTMAYLVRRPLAELGSLVDLSVMIFFQRSDIPGDGETPYGEYADPRYVFIPSSAAAESTSITIGYGNNPVPDIRRRSWVLDTTNGTVVNAINGHFYRVENVTDDPNAKALTLDLDRPLKAACKRVVHFRDLIAVIDRGSNW